MPGTQERHKNLGGCKVGFIQETPLLEKQSTIIFPLLLLFPPAASEVTSTPLERVLFLGITLG